MVINEAHPDKEILESDIKSEAQDSQNEEGTEIKVIKEEMGSTLAVKAGQNNLVRYVENDEDFRVTHVDPNIEAQRASHANQLKIALPGAEFVAGSLNPTDLPNASTLRSDLMTISTIEGQIQKCSDLEEFKRLFSSYAQANSHVMAYLVSKQAVNEVTDTEHEDGITQNRSDIEFNKESAETNNNKTVKLIMVSVSLLALLAVGTNMIFSQNSGANETQGAESPESLPNSIKVSVTFTNNGKTVENIKFHGFDQNSFQRLLSAPSSAQNIEKKGVALVFFKSNITNEVFYLDIPNYDQNGVAELQLQKINSN